MQIYIAIILNDNLCYIARASFQSIADPNVLYVILLFISAWLSRPWAVAIFMPWLHEREKHLEQRRVKMVVVVVSQFNGTSTPKGSYSAKTGDNACNVNSSRYSLSTALCESNSLSGQVWTKCPTRPDTQGRHVEAALMHPWKYGICTLLFMFLCSFVLSVIYCCFGKIHVCHAVANKWWWWYHSLTAHQHQRVIQCQNRW